MENLLKSITREPYGITLEEVISRANEGDEISVVFKAIQKQQEEKPIHILGDSMRRGREYIVKVKKWMTQATVDDNFTFMRQWNGNIPMPFRIMRGRVLSESRGMVFMELRAEPLETDYCMKCGKPLSHPVSRLYGLGPECGGHYHINPFETEEELHSALDEIQKKLNNITWKGWIARSGIEYATEVASSSANAGR